MDFITELSLDSKFLQSCDIETPAYRMEPFCLVIHGGSGDLATRKLLPTIFSLYQQGELPARFSIVSVGLPALSDAGYRELMSGSCQAALGEAFDAGKWETFGRQLHSIGG